MNEMKRLKRDLIIWRMLSSCYFVFIFLSALPVAVLLQDLLAGAKVFEKSRIITSVSLLSACVIFACITLCFRAFLIKMSSRNTYKNPCGIPLHIHNEMEFISLFGKKTRIKKIAHNCWYGKESGRRDLRVFVFEIHETSLGSTLNLANMYVKRVNEKTSFPSLIDKDMHQHMGRIQLFLYDDVPQIVLNSAARSVEDNIEQPEFLVNLFVGLKEGVLYIPFCRSRLLGVGRLYQYAINRVEEWLFTARDYGAGAMGRSEEAEDGFHVQKG